VRRLLTWLILAALAAEARAGQTPPPAIPAPAPPANAARVTLGDVIVLQFRVASGAPTPLRGVPPPRSSARPSCRTVS
jgi:hypothetical protein